MTPFEQVTARIDARDAAMTRAVGDVCAAHALDRCIGDGCPLWTPDVHARSRRYFRDCDAYRDLMGVSIPDPLPRTAVPLAPARGVCGLLEAHDG